MIVRNILNATIDEKQEPNVMAIGYFDGVHLGHQKVIQKAIEKAKLYNLLSSIMIFNPHPMEVLKQDYKIEEITPLSVKLSYFQKLGIDVCYIVKFTEDFARLSPSYFIENILIKLNIKGVVVGYDFSFGANGSGKAETLKEISNGRYTTDIVDPFFISNSKVSSTRIRESLIEGNISDANVLLGRRYSIIGKVVHGVAQGREIGFPTANLYLLEDYLHIKNGVYVVNITYKENNFLGLMNVGYRPTFDYKDNKITYEIHIINFNEDIYGELLEVELIDYLREEKKFNGINELKEQINNDINKAEQIYLYYMI